jgi:hypothetical protein
VPEYRFGFTVEYLEAEDDDEQSGWQVSLPHQCGPWRIDHGSSYFDREPQADALAALDAFIAEAQQAREALAAGKTYGEAS